MTSIIFLSFIQAQLSMGTVCIGFKNSFVVWEISEIIYDFLLKFKLVFLDIIEFFSIQYVYFFFCENSRIIRISFSFEITWNTWSRRLTINFSIFSLFFYEISMSTERNSCEKKGGKFGKFVFSMKKKLS